MAEIVKYIYVIIIFLSLFFGATNIEGKPFRSQISFFSPDKIFYCIFVTLSYSLSSLYQGRFRCKDDLDCVHKRCRGPMRAKCISKSICKCRL